MSKATDVVWEALEEAALEVQARAYCPYSEYPVGAAILGRSGRIYAGCNVENAAYGHSICAERSAIMQMVAAGEREPIAVLVVTRGPKAGSPCGACRQMLVEFAEDLPIRLMVNGEPERTRTTSLAELLPDAFRPDSLLPKKS
ncbi:MAG: cytidine deaminase [Polyangiaceae bacterium]|nr:cytidine deaminase [Polyangiaceae bacterium]